MLKQVLKRTKFNTVNCGISTKKLNCYLSIANITWITESYSFEEYESKREYQFKNQHYTKVRVNCEEKLIGTKVKNT